MKTNVFGRVKNISLPLSQSLLPLFEAIINSLDALEDAQVKPEEGQIDIRILRTPELPLEVKETDNSPLEAIYGFEITDNGIGFTERNFASFDEAETQNKAERGGKGVGRFLWLKAFSRIEIDSIYEQGGQYFQRIFEFSTSHEDGISSLRLNCLPSSIKRQTTVKLYGFKEQYAKNAPRNSVTVAQRIVEHCLEYFVLGKMPTMCLIEDDKAVINLNNVYHELVANTERISLKIGEYNFELTHFMLKSRSSLSHRISYCANRRAVISENVGKKIPNLPSRLPGVDDDESMIYAGYVSSNYLDKVVNQQRTGFDTPPKDGLFAGELSWQEIEEHVIKASADALQKFTESVKLQKEQQIREYVNNHAPEYRHILKNHPTLLDKIDANLPDEKLNLALYELHREIEWSLKVNANDYLKAPLPWSDQFTQERENFSKFWEEWNEVGKANLAKYITHRKLMLDFLDKALGIQDDGKYSKEEVVHQIIFPLRSTSDNITYDDHNLWIIDEKLSYHRYLASDMPLKKNEALASISNSRPDLMFFFDHPIAVVDEEAPFNTGIVIFEFKRPMRDNYDADDNPIQQVLKYVEEIKDGKIVDKNGRPVNVPPTIPFYCYIVCDLTRRLKDQAKYANLRLTPDAGGYFGYNDTIGAYIEIIDFAKLVRDAKQRNRVLFDKLNLPSHL